MVSNISSALNAYQQALSRIGTKVQAGEENSAKVNSDFKNMVTETISNAADLSKKAEQTSMAHIAGKADIQDVVLAVSNAELALETVVAVRDTAIKAYKEIMNMSI